MHIENAAFSHPQGGILLQNYSEALKLYMWYCPCCNDEMLDYTVSSSVTGRGWLGHSFCGGHVTCYCRSRANLAQQHTVFAPFASRLSRAEAAVGNAVDGAISAEGTRGPQTLLCATEAATEHTQRSGSTSVHIGLHFYRRAVSVMSWLNAVYLIWCGVLVNLVCSASCSISWRDE